MKYFPHASAHPPSLLRKTAAAIITVGVAAVAVMFSAALLAVLAIFVAFGAAYLWWKTRHIRKQLRNFPPGAAMGGGVFHGQAFGGQAANDGAFQREPSGRDTFFDGPRERQGEIIEGEAVRVDERDGKH